MKEPANTLDEIVSAIAFDIVTDNSDW